MSREIRRVPVGWKHPVEYNPYWQQQSRPFMGKQRPPSRLHGPAEQFVSLMRGPLSKALAEWEQERAEWEAGTHEHLAWLMSYHAADGWTDHKGVKQPPNPYKVYGDDGETVVREFFPASVSEIQAVYSYSEYAGDRPDASLYMPDFDVPEDELGWCLYQTVSEGTPVTPVFATAAELVDWLCEVGEDYDQEPYRRASAEALVSQGSSFASMVVIREGGTTQVLDSAKDADVLAARNG